MDMYSVVSHSLGDVLFDIEMSYGHHLDQHLLYINHRLKLHYIFHQYQYLDISEDHCLRSMQLQ